MHEAFKQCGQHQEDDQCAEQEDEGHGAAGVAQVQGLALVVDDQGVRQAVAGKLFDVVQRITQRQPRCHGGVDGDGAVAVVAVEVGGAGVFLDGDQVGQRDQRAADSRAHVDVLHAGGRALVQFGRLEDHIVLFASIQVGGDPA